MIARSWEAFLKFAQYDIEETLFYFSTQEISIVKSEKFSVVGKLLWNDFKLAYTNLYVLKWSLWWAFSLCGSYFVSKMLFYLQLSVTFFCFNVLYRMYVCR